jgi:SPP1 family predicted phage head-tail adaptor
MAKCCSEIRACDMRHTIVFQAENSTADGAGGFTAPWASPTDVATVRACVEPLRGFERLRSMQLENPVTHKITTRFRTGLKPEHRIKFTNNGETRFFNIVSIINIEERNRWIEIMAIQGVAL